MAQYVNDPWARAQMREAAQRDAGSAGRAGAMPRAAPATRTTVKPPAPTSLQAMEQRAAVPGAAEITGQIGQQQAIAGRLQADPNVAARLAAESDFRNGQAALIGQLTSRAQGVGPSLAARQINADAAAARSRANSAAAGAPPGMEGLALLSAARSRGDINAQALEQSAQAQMAERQAAESQLAQALLGARGQDQATAQFNAQQQLSADQLGTQRLGMANEMQLGLLGQRLNLAGMQQQGGMSINQILAAQEAQRRQLESQSVPWYARLGSALLGAGGAVAGTILGGPVGGAAGATAGSAIGGAITGGRP